MKKIIVIGIILLLIGAYLVKSYNDLNLKETDDLQTFIKLYSGWVYNLIFNIKDVTGYATKKTWLPKDTNKTSNNSE